MRKLIQTLFFFLLVTQICFAQWTQTTGPYGDFVNCFTRIGGDIFAAGGGVIISPDNGSTWTESSTGLEGLIITALAGSGTSLLAGTYDGGVFITTDKVANWTQTSLIHGQVNSLTVNGDDIFASTENGLYLSNDNGMSWNAINSGLTNISVYSVVISGTNLFACTYDGVFLSTNKGTSWTKTGSLNHEPGCLAISGTTLFVGTNFGVYISTDNGSIWTSGGLTETRVWSFTVNELGVFAITGGGIYRSTNNGEEWIQIYSDTVGGTVYSFNINGSTLFVGASSGIYRSTDNAKSWQQVGYKLHPNISRIVATSTQVFVSGYNPCPHCDMGPKPFAYHSYDSGNNWRSSWFVSSLITIGDILIAGAQYGNGVLLSYDDGLSWTAVNINAGLTAYNVNSLAISGTSLFAGTDDGIFLSNNNSTSWTHVGLPSTNVNCLAVNGSVVFAGTDSRIFYSSNNGTIWEAVNSGLVDTSVSSFAVVGTNVYACTRGSIILSTNNGTSWSSLKQNLPANTQVNSLVASETNLFAGTDAGVFLSGDGGNNWMPVNEGLTNLYISSVAVGGTNLFAVSGTVWRRPLSEMITTVGAEEILPKEFALEQNYPNPFNPSTKISWQLPVSGQVTLKVYNVLGREVSTLVNEYRQAGSYEVDFNASELPSGVYFYRLKAGEFTATRKMILIK